MFHVVIPARYGSTRLPGKALADINGYPMVYWVWRRACASSAASVVVATDHQDIAEVMQQFGAQVALTRADHPSGTDRLAEVAEQQGWSAETIVVNLQGDEPLMPAENVEQVASELAKHPEASIATLAEPLTSEAQLTDPSVVKVVHSASGEALYFSRASIPFCRDERTADNTELMRVARRHVGLYAYRCGFLKRFVSWPPAPLEQIESLEQLRALHHKEIIRVSDARLPVPAGVDTEDDLIAVRKLMESITNAS